MPSFLDFKESRSVVLDAAHTLHGALLDYKRPVSEMIITLPGSSVHRFDRGWGVGVGVPEGSGRCRPVASRVAPPSG